MEAARLAVLGVVNGSTGLVSEPSARMRSTDGLRVWDCSSCNSFKDKAWYTGRAGEGGFAVSSLSSS